MDYLFTFRFPAFRASSIRRTNPAIAASCSRRSFAASDGVFASCTALPRFQTMSTTGFLLPSAHGWDAANASAFPASVRASPLYSVLSAS